mmetsp:Transcript_12066/g.19628  ORF Transcript_12066/g.19628 Transcript_12066/m.19628 type:complete len:283 (-) Transcript_12066:399-1247(-)
MPSPVHMSRIKDMKFSESIGCLAISRPCRLWVDPPRGQAFLVTSVTNSDVVWSSRSALILVHLARAFVGMNVSTEHQIHLVIKQNVFNCLLHRNTLGIDGMRFVAVNERLMERDYNPRGDIAIHAAQITFQPGSLSTSFLQARLLMRGHHFRAISSHHHEVDQSSIERVIQFLSPIHSGILEASFVSFEVVNSIEPLMVAHSGLERNFGRHSLAQVAETIPQRLHTIGVAEITERDNATRLGRQQLLVLTQLVEGVLRVRSLSHISHHEEGHVIHQARMGLK